MVLNLVEELRPAWERYKKDHTIALRELHRSFLRVAPAIQHYRYAQAVEWDQCARIEWRKQLTNVLGVSFRIEWIGNGPYQACIVNGVLYFG